MSYSSGYQQMPKVSGYKNVQMPQYTPQQMQFFQKLMGGVGGGLDQSMNYLQQMAAGDESMFEQMEKPAYTAFDKMLGQIGSRYSGMGARDSSAYENAMAGAGAEMAENLQAKRAQMQQSAIEKLLGMSESLLGQRPYENMLLQKPQKQGFDWGAVAGATAPHILKMLFGGVFP